ncbi:hypothetical protein [[Eubacterium] cellulosolvens]
MSEANLWEWLRDVVLPLGQYSRIESGDTSPGFPDVHAQLGPGISVTIELKYSRRARELVPFTSRRGMRRSQLRWIKDNLRNGGTVWVIAEAKPEIFVIHGRLAQEINGADRAKLHGIATEVLQRDDPERAARMLHRILVEEDYD